AMTEEQHKSVVIDCSSSQPQFCNAGHTRHKQFEEIYPTGRNESLCFV
ncbi:C17orf75 isoform 4, partial [Pan troglodytes]